jgi:pimeloyl-ACP methyl ester carboxylesterase
MSEVKMPTFSANGVEIYYEVTGQGFPLIWSHEFGGSYDSWEAQVKFFSRRYQVVTYAARGWPPSDVPEDPAAYTQDIVVNDLYLLMRHLNISQAHIGGLSMGGSVALNFGIAHPEMAKSLIVASAGSGSTNRDVFLATGQSMADRLISEGMIPVAEDYGTTNIRVQLRRKDPMGFETFAHLLSEHSATGSALTYQGFVMNRPTVFELEDKLKSLRVPTLIMIGDEDEPCIEPGIFMKRAIPLSGLSCFPQSGHAINLEEPDLFNRTVLDFLTAVEAERWAERPT